MTVESGILARVSQIEHIGVQIERTEQREHIQELGALGWKAVVLWECQIKLDFENAFFKR